MGRSFDPTDQGLRPPSIIGATAGGGTTTPGTGTGSTPPPGGGTPSGSTLPAGFNTVWSENFSSGTTGMLSRVWGPGVEVGAGYLTMRSTADDQDSGAMVPPTGASAGYGYGLYSFVLITNGVIGGYALTWPATDVWPGPELDVLEILESNEPYATVHWDDNGNNGYYSHMWGVDPTVTHTYSMWWQPGSLTFYCDGVQIGNPQYDHVPNDYANGQENTCPGIGMQTHWNSGGSRGSWITCYEVSYATAA